MKKLFFISFLCFTAASKLIANEGLVKQWKEVQSDNDRYELADDIILAYSFQSSDEKERLLFELRKADEASPQNLQYWNQYIAAAMLASRSMYFEAISTLDSCFKHSPSPFLKILALSQKGKVHTIIRELEIGYKDLTSSLNAANTYHYDALRFKSYVHLAEFKRKVDLPAEGLVYVDSAYALFQKYNYRNATTVEMFDRKAALYTQNGQVDSIPYNSRKALSIAIQLNDLHGQAVSYNELGYYFQETFQHDSSLYYYNLAHEIWSQSELVLYLTGIVVNKASLLVRMKRLDEAELLLENYELRADTAQWIEMKYPIYDVLARLHEEKGDEELKWYYRYKQYVAVHASDSKSNIDKIEKLRVSIEQNKKTRQLEKKEMELSLKEKNLYTSNQQRNYTIAFSIILVILLTVTILSLVQSRRARKQLASSNKHLEAANQTKDVLLAEIHHRVKNNFQMISSLLRIQAHAIDDQKASEELLEAEGRIHSLSQVHQRLYQGESFDRIRLDQLLQDMIIPFLSSSTEDLDKAIDLETPDIDIHIEQAVPLGSVVHELLTNSFKYAWPNGETNKKIQLHFQKEKDELIFAYHDNGVGLPKNYSLKNPTSMGSTIIQLSIERQLDGECTFNITNGADYKFKFKLRYD